MRVAVIGAGVAGLNAGRQLEAAGMDGLPSGLWREGPVASFASREGESQLRHRPPCVMLDVPV